MTGDRLSRRLSCVASMVTRHEAVYDVGCDHAYLAIHLVSSGIAGKAYACDINPGPLKAAEENINREGYGNRIETVLSNGLHNIPKPLHPSALVIAGMGGMLILDILREGKDKLDAFDEIIISPQSNVDMVRERLTDAGLHIHDEDMVYEDGKFYTVIKLGHEPCEYHFPIRDEGLTGSDMVFIQNRYGPKLIEKRSPCLKEYLDRERTTLERVRLRLLSEGDVDNNGHNRDKLEAVSRNITYNEMLKGGLYGNDQNR